MAEAGIAGFKVSTWFGMLAPRGTPKASVWQTTLRCPEGRTLAIVTQTQIALPPRAGAAPGDEPAP